MKSFKLKENLEKILKSIGAEGEAKLIIEECSGHNYIPYEELKEDIVERAVNIAKKRVSERKPLAYILKKWWFYDIELYIEEGVFIPRSESEILVDTALNLLRGKEKIKVLEYGVGSGAIILSLLKHNGGVTGFGTDVSRKSLRVTQINARKLGLQERIHLIETDSLKAIKDDAFDMLISNPPYIKLSEFKALPPEVREWEPKEALIGGDSGLEHVKHLLKEGKRIVREGGYIVFEIGYSTASEAMDLAEYYLKDVDSKFDLNGIRRVIWGKKS